jgi:hypothetical protein
MQSSPILEEVKQPDTTPDVRDYSKKDYLAGLQIRLTRARDQLLELIAVILCQ